MDQCDDEARSTDVGKHPQNLLPNAEYAMQRLIIQPKPMQCYVTPRTAKQYHAQMRCGIMCHTMARYAAAPC
eukprot:3606693-Pyramimonas_sp.AAC.1